MMRKNYNIKKTISIKQFISEFGENFSEHIKQRLSELEIRCVLKRKEETYILDLKHVEHKSHTCYSDNNSGTCEKEFIYAQFIVIEGILYFSENCTEDSKMIASPIINTIYNSLNSEGIISVGENSAKVIDDSNIDFIIDSILSVCPEVSQAYLDIVQGMLFRAKKD